MTALFDRHGSDRPAAVERAECVPSAEEEQKSLVERDDPLAPSRGITLSVLLGLTLWALVAAAAWYLL